MFFKNPKIKHFFKSKFKILIFKFVEIVLKSIKAKYFILKALKLVNFILVLELILLNSKILKIK